jgi:hypothetical protein
MKETVVCKKTVFVMILCLVCYMPVQTVQQSGRASNVMTMSNFQMAPEDLSEINKNFSAMDIGKHKPSKLGACKKI